MKDCNRCKGNGWLKWYKDKKGRKRFAADCLVYRQVGKRFIRWMPVCPCTIEGFRNHPEHEHIRQVEYERYQGGQSVKYLAEMVGFTEQQMKIRLCSYASTKNLPLKNAEIIHYEEYPNGSQPIYCLDLE